MTTRLLSAGALVLGPLLWLCGLTIRAIAGARVPDHLRDEPFAVPGELAVYRLDPALVVAGYAVFLAGAVVMVIAVAVLTRLATPGAPVLAPVGGLLLATGLGARLYWAGVEQTAFGLADAYGTEFAVAFVLDAYADLSYGPWRLPVIAACGQYAGGALLAAALYRARVLGLGRALVVAWWATIWGGVLKAAGWGELPGALLLVLILVPVAIEVGRTGSVRPSSRRRLLSW
ncbi:hypothetical protein [Catenuloplanes atrovinosus]|uniref:Uncharacterized protein n=1 Tax=Catenuloplanes atrovinosus TaxID=137266 RepID=A0AAE3YLR2_9ACTN|nr:hypothetical protein [Catenuloplanes atrovinosus]MDR7275302.1 hypothetical protein [Catenuloplanes atrovinosus]